MKTAFPFLLTIFSML